MRSEYDFSRSRKNPYAKQLKRPITIRPDTSTVDYFKRLAAEMGMPYQNLINLFLRDCAIEKRRPVIQWPGEAPGPVLGAAAQRRGTERLVRKQSRPFVIQPRLTQPFNGERLHLLAIFPAAFG